MAATGGFTASTDASMTSNPLRANGHRRDQVRRRVLAEEDHCWLCNQPVDKTLPPFTDASPEVDEVIPVSLGGSPIDRSNCRLAHRVCNRTRGNGATLELAKPLTTSRRWVGG